MTESENAIIRATTPELGKGEKGLAEAMWPIGGTLLTRSHLGKMQANLHAAALDSSGVLYYHTSRRLQSLKQSFRHQSCRLRKNGFVRKGDGFGVFEATNGAE